MLSTAKHLAFSLTCEDEILRLLPQDDITTQPRGEEIESLERFDLFERLKPVEP
jgi:hypothetical protein